MTQKISISEAAQLLDYKDSRSIEKWCQKNGVKIFLVHNSRKRYLIRMQFEYARLKKFIEYLKKEYQLAWFDVFKIYMSMDIERVVEMEENRNYDFALETNSYKPQGNHEISFLNSLTINLSE